MELVVDSNILISGLISISGKTSELLFSDKLKLYAPEYLLEEIDKHKSEVSEKSGLSIEEIGMLLSLISLNVELVPFSEFKEFENEASKICPDPNDVEYLALAMKLGCPLWSEDKALKRQGKVKIFTTSELLKIL